MLRYEIEGEEIFPIQVHSDVILLLLQQIFIFIFVAADTRAVPVPGIYKIIKNKHLSIKSVNSNNSETMHCYLMPLLFVTE